MTHQSLQQSCDRVKNIVYYSKKYAAMGREVSDILFCCFLYLDQLQVTEVMDSGRKMIYAGACSVDQSIIPFR